MTGGLILSTYYTTYNIYCDNYYNYKEFKLVINNDSLRIPIKCVVK